MSAADGNGEGARPTPNLFAGLEGEDLAAVRSLGKQLELGAGQPLFALGDEARRIMLVRSGVVALTLPLVIRGASHEITVDEKEAGEVVGWSALVPPHKFILGAKAVSDVSLEVFGRTELAALFAERPSIHLQISCNLNRVIASRAALLEAVLARNLQRWADDQ